MIAIAAMLAFVLTTVMAMAGVGAAFMRLCLVGALPRLAVQLSTAASASSCTPLARLAATVVARQRVSSGAPAHKPYQLRLLLAALACTLVINLRRHALAGTELAPSLHRHHPRAIARDRSGHRAQHAPRAVAVGQPSPAARGLRHCRPAPGRTAGKHPVPGPRVDIKTARIPRRGRVTPSRSIRSAFEQG
jgi:hypothetical protein